MRWGRVLAVWLPLLLVGGLWGAWQYRQYRSYQALIPKQTTCLIRIHLDGLFRDVGLNAFWNRAHYDSLRHNGPEGADFRSWPNTGASMPANLFLFQLPHVQSEIFPHIYFGTLQLTDTAAFTTLLRTHFAMQIFRGGDEPAIAVADRVLVVFSADRACFAVSLRKPVQDIAVLEEVLHSLLAAEGHVPVSESAFRDIKHLGGHIGWQGRGRRAASIRFNAGVAKFSLTLPAVAAPSLSGGVPDFPDTNAASFWLNGMVGDWLAGKRLDFGGYTLHGDSLLKHYQGSMALEWKGTVMQTDTMISYDYDADFVMQERRELVERPVPDIRLAIAADTGLMGYLARQDVMDPTHHLVNRSAFPLFRINAGATSRGYMQWFTAVQPAALPPSGEGDGEMLHVRIDFTRLDSQALPVSLSPILGILDSLEATGVMAGETAQEITGNLRMKNYRINSLVQLLHAGRLAEHL